MDSTLPPRNPIEFTSARGLTPRIVLLVLVFAIGSTAPRSAAEPGAAPIRLADGGDASFSHEVQRAIDRGLAWLRANQNSNGWWSTPDHPAVTALALSAFMNDPSGQFRPPPDFVKRGYDYLLANVKPDGGIHRGQLVTYNTAISMMALLAANDPAYDAQLRRSRRFLVGLQSDFGEKGKADDDFDGGIGYGSKYEHSDMGNTVAALEAIAHTRHLERDQPAGTARDLNWAAAVQFLQNCQNLPAYNQQAWASDDATNRGGFVYYPGHSMAGGTTNAETGRVALRSYGSISYAGLLSYIYADLKSDDPRVTAVLDWLQRNYTLDENPGMGLQGLYYYFQTMTKALSAADVKQIALPDGRKIDWRRELGMKLLNLQQRDGSWANTDARWWEKDPVLVTAYVALSLETLKRGMTASSSLAPVK